MNKSLIDKLEQTKILSKEEYLSLLSGFDDSLSDYLFEKSRKVTLERFGNRIYTRGLIEFTNYCKNDCYYCGIRRSNREAARYRLSAEEILSCCAQGYALEFRTFVLQGGEDPFYTDELMADIISKIKSAYPDCALTLSIGERSKESYRKLYSAGADRYLLRHETANLAHYAKLHPEAQTLETRLACLHDLKQIGFQVGTGFMVGSPYQTDGDLADDLMLLQSLRPHMTGIGPYLPHHETPFAGQPAGSVKKTLFLIGLIRLMLPDALIPATTALGTIHQRGREMGILAGANVVMPNLSPVKVRKQYELYDNKICTGEEAAECRGCLGNRMQSIGYTLAKDRGDHILKRV